MLPRSAMLLAVSALALHRAAAIVDPDDVERRHAFKYPGCNHLREQPYRKVDWLWLRDQLHELPYPEKLSAVYEALGNLTGPGIISSVEYDLESRVCMMGVPAAFFYLTKYSLDVMEEERLLGADFDHEQMQKVITQYSIFENYISAVHPGIYTNANWTLTEHEVFWLRKRVLMVYQQLAKQDAERENVTLPFRVYVYDEQEVPELKPLLQSQIYCSRGQWGMDVTVHDFFASSALRTFDPAEADFFLVPGYAICVLEGNIFNLDEVDELYKKLVRALPHFGPNNGRDHIFVFGSGMSHSVFQSWKDFIPQSIVLTPETELFNDFAWMEEPSFDPWRDIAIPGALDITEVVSLLDRSKPLAERKYLGAFFGRSDIARGAHPWVGGVNVREAVLSLKQHDRDGTELWFDANQTHDVMHEAYGSARFCFCPRGKSGWSLRFFEALFAGCVPVVLSDKWELPFEQFLDVANFVIKWPTTRVNEELMAYLRELPDDVVQAYMDEGKRLRCWYFYPPKKLDVRGYLRKHHKVCPEENGQDAFKGILRVLQTKVRRSRSSFTSFYFRDLKGTLRHVSKEFRPWGAPRAPASSPEGP